MNIIDTYKEDFLDYLNETITIKEPKNLYEPIDYILQIGGKRLRPILTLLTCDLFGGNSKHAYDAALAIEVFHNFTLIHDDIMDSAPIRRGKETVHIKWNVNTGILSGDAMLILAYQYFENYEPKIFQALAKLFSKTALEVCEGQQYDVDFETRDDVTIPEYLKMIEYKTAVLLGAAMKMGAIVAETSEENADLIYNFGLNLGIAFQLQDDYLDAFGNPETFGKQVGGDIIENKKTYLYLKAMEFSNEANQQQLLHLFSIQKQDNTDKIESVKAGFNASGVSKATQDASANYTEKAFETLEKMHLSEDKKTILRLFGEKLMNRNV